MSANINNKTSREQHISAETLCSETNVPKSTLRFRARVSTKLHYFAKVLRKSECGMTIAELLVVTAVASLLIVPTVTVVLYFYGDTVTSNLQSRLAVESQNILRSMVEELRVSSGIRSSNTISDPNAPGGGWTTSNASLILIISTPALDTANNFIMDPLSGDPYQNELVYFAVGNTLYKRYLANSSATGNRFKTSCPAALATASCPPDVEMTPHFEAMNFVFYDQDDIATTTLTDARSIKLLIEMKRRVGGRDIQFDNNIRVTLRNSL